MIETILSHRERYTDRERKIEKVRRENERSGREIEIERERGKKIGFTTATPPFSNG